MIGMPWLVAFVHCYFAAVKARRAFSRLRSLDNWGRTPVHFLEVGSEENLKRSA